MQWIEQSLRVKPTLLSDFVTVKLNLLLRINARNGYWKKQNFLHYFQNSSICLYYHQLEIITKNPYLILLIDLCVASVLFSIMWKICSSRNVMYFLSGFYPISVQIRY